MPSTDADRQKSAFASALSPSANPHLDKNPFSDSLVRQKMISAFKNPQGQSLEAAGMRIGFLATPKSIRGPDDVASHFGLRRLGEDWIAVDRDAARSVARFLLCQDQAYRRPRLPKETAERLSDDFFAWFPVDTQFFTNGRVDFPDTKDAATGTIFHAGWTPATDATFDSGIIAFGGWSGIFWIEDED